MRLVDADKIIKSVTHEMSKAELNSPIYCTLECVIADIGSQPTAYEAEEVIKSINEIGQRYCNSVKCGKNCEDCEHGCLMRAIINVVKSGGVSNGK